MAVDGTPHLQLSPTAAEGLNIAVISCLWNASITDQLHYHAMETARNYGAHVTGFRVTGAMELPVAVHAACQHFDAVIATGCVIEGDTEHFRVVCDAVTYGLTKVSVDTHTPVGNAVLTVSNYDQAYRRAGGEGSQENKGADAAIAAIHTALLLNNIHTHHAS